MPYLEESKFRLDWMDEYIENKEFWPDYGQGLNLGATDTETRNWDWVRPLSARNFWSREYHHALY
jgi:hypothetical protein